MVVSYFLSCGRLGRPTFTDRGARKRRAESPLMNADRPADPNPGERLLQHLAEGALIHEAEEAAQGIRALTITTGCPETADEDARIATVIQAAWAGYDGARTISVGGGGDYTTIRISGPRAEDFAHHLAALAHQANPGWWRITHSPHPTF